MNVPTAHDTSLGHEQERGARPRRPEDGPQTHDAQGGNPTREATRGRGVRLRETNAQNRFIRGREGGSWGPGAGGGVAGEVTADGDGLL